MHNIFRNGETIDNAFIRTKFKLHEEKRKFCDDNEVYLKNAHEDYDKKAAGGELNKLISIWDEKKDADKREKAKSLYGSNRNVISEHWEVLKNNNGDRYGELICPMCGINVAEEMDHFAPRSLFPEYSTHLTNLIPLCHSCNHDKSDDWLNEKGLQIFFNAYFDKIDFEKLFEVKVEYLAKNKVMRGRVEFSKDFKPTTYPEHLRVKMTISKLNLNRVFNREVEKTLRGVINSCISSFATHKSRYATPDDFIAEKIKEWKDQLKRGNFGTKLEKMLYRQLTDNTSLHPNLAKHIAENI